MYRVLIVDDDPDTRILVSQILERDDFIVKAVQDAAEALVHLRSANIDLVITDICMDGMNGLDLTSAIQTGHPEIATVVMTGHSSMDSAVGAIRAGACDYLVKPFKDFDTVIRTAYRALDTMQAARDRSRLISSLTESNQELREMAIRDGLTEVYNYRHITELLSIEFERAVRYQRSLSVLFLDVDHFKQYNDINGHQQGDGVLRDVAQLLQQNTRQSDAVGRWGGEEFVVLAPETTMEAAAALAEKLRFAIAAHDFPGRESQPYGYLSISAGVATLKDGDSTTSLVDRADKALYEAKSAGRNTVRRAA